MKYQIKIKSTDIGSRWKLYWTTDIKDLINTLYENEKDIKMKSLMLVKKDISKSKPSVWLTSGYYE